MKHAVRGQNTELLFVTAGGTYSYHWSCTCVHTCSHMVCAVPSAVARGDLCVFGCSIAMVAVAVGAGGCGGLLVVMVEDAWGAAHPSSPWHHAL
jgi:hypothetical protein